MISLVILAGIILLGFLLYYPVTAYGWITGPDLDSILGNRLINRFSVNNIFDIFLSMSDGMYRPLTVLSLGLQASWMPANPSVIFHWANLVLHLLCVVMLFRLVQLLGRSNFMAGIAALIFCIHPLNTEAVAWISSHGILLSTFFMLAGLLSYVYYTRPCRARGYFMQLSYLCFILALLAHPISIIFPLFLILLDLLTGPSEQKSTRRKIPGFILSAVFLFIAIAGMSGAGNDPQDIMPAMAGRVMFAISSPWVATAAFVAPFFQSPHHPYPMVMGYQYLLVIPGLAILIALLIITRKKSMKVFAALMFVIIAVTAAAVLFIDDPAYLHENSLYPAIAGLSAILSMLVVYLFRKYFLQRKALLIPVSVILALYAALLTYLATERVALWEDSGKLWTDAIIKYPHDHHAYFLRGDHWAMTGDFEKAKFDYSQAIRLNASAYKAINNIGLIYMEEGELRYAISEFERAIGISPDFYKPYLNRGIAYMRIGMNEKALEDMDMAAALNPAEPLVYYNRGLIFERKTELNRAVEELTTAIKLAPSVALFYKERGKVYIWMQQHRLAELDYSKAIELNPGDAEMWFRRSMARVTRNNLKGGLQDAIMARQLGYPVEEEYIKGLTVQVLEADSVKLE